MLRSEPKIFHGRESELPELAMLNHFSGGANGVCLICLWHEHSLTSLPQLQPRELRSGIIWLPNDSRVISTKPRRQLSRSNDVGRDNDLDPIFGFPLLDASIFTVLDHRRRRLATGQTHTHPSVSKLCEALASGMRDERWHSGTIFCVLIDSSVFFFIR
jgi:hypothetical protein